MTVARSGPEGREVRRRTDRGTLPDRATASRTDAPLHGRDPGHHLGRDRGRPARWRSGSATSAIGPRPGASTATTTRSSRIERLEAVLDVRVRGVPRRRAGLAARRQPVPAQRHPHPRTRTRRSAWRSARAAARRRSTTTRWRRSAPTPSIALAGADARRAHRPVARRAAHARRPGVRRRSVRPDRRPVARAPRAAGSRRRQRGRRRDPRLRGVHLAVRGGVDGAVGAMAPVDRPDGDAARRPRSARRLEHVDVVAAVGHRAGLVARPGRRRLRLVLGVPAPRQPQPDRAGDRARVRPDARADDGRGALEVPGRLGLARRPGLVDVALQLLPRPRRHRSRRAGRRHRLALLAPPRPRRPAHGRRHRVGVGARAGARHRRRSGITSCSARRCRG